MKRKKFAREKLVHGQKTILGFDKMPKMAALIGTQIVDVGFCDSQREGGLTLDTVKPRSKKVTRTVFGYNELGLWIAWQGEKA